MAYYRLGRNNVGCFIRNIIRKRNCYSKPDCFGYGYSFDCITDLEYLSGICCQPERYRYCACRLPFNHTHIDVGNVYMELELYS